MILVRVNSSEKLVLPKANLLQYYAKNEERHWEENEWSPDRATSETPGTNHHPVDDKCRDKSRTQEETSRTTKTATKRQSAIVPTHH